MGWIEDRKKLLNQIKNQVRRRVGDEPSSYGRVLKNEFLGNWKKTNLNILYADLLKTEVAFGSDFHAFSQSQKSHIRILREITRPVVLGLECFEAEHQADLDSFMKGLISPDDLKIKTRWDERWQFPFENYLPLLKLAKEKNFCVIGLNLFLKDRSSKSLKKRDQFAAAQVLKSLKKNPMDLHYVIFGEFHLAKHHLPQALLKTAPSLKILVLFQDVDVLYFRYAKKNSFPEILKSTAGRYVLMTSPPWVKWQSYLMYLEKTYDSDLDNQDIDPTDHVVHLARVLAADIKAEINESMLSVYSPESLTFEKVIKKLSRPEIEVVHQLVKADRTFLIPSLQAGYLSRLSVNHAANLAGHFVHAQLSGNTKNYFAIKKYFLIQIWLEAVAFFLSKLMNPKRKSETLQSLKIRAELKGPAMSLALDQRVSEMVALNLGRTRPVKVKKFLVEHGFEAAKILGHMLGERMFAKFSDKENDLKSFKKIIEQKIEEDHFDEFYFQILRRFET